MDSYLWAGIGRYGRSHALLLGRQKTFCPERQLVAFLDKSPRAASRPSLGWSRGLARTNTLRSSGEGRSIPWIFPSRKPEGVWDAPLRLPASGGIPKGRHGP